VNAKHGFPQNFGYGFCQGGGCRIMTALFGRAASDWCQPVEPQWA
jgi:hypothetical protein